MAIDELLKDTTALFVEDDQQSREIFGRLLSSRVGCVHQAANGQEGLEMFCRFNPDVVITDLEMPIMNGVEMIRHIRDLGHKTPIIITTGYVDDEHSTELANRTLIKPIIFSRLMDALKECIAERFS
jgi:CheY-like chemotaxis protein